MQRRHNSEPTTPSELGMLEELAALSGCVALRVDAGRIRAWAGAASEVLGRADPTDIALDNIFVDTAPSELGVLDVMRADGSIGTVSWTALPGGLALIRRVEEPRALIVLDRSQDRVRRLTERFRGLFALSAETAPRTCRQLVERCGARLARGPARLDEILDGPGDHVELTRDGRLLALRAHEDRGAIRLEVEDLTGHPALDHDARAAESAVWAERVRAGLVHELSNALMPVMAVVDELERHPSAPSASLVHDLQSAAARAQAALADARDPSVPGRGRIERAVVLGLRLAAPDLRKVGARVSVELGAEGEIALSEGHAAQLVVHGLEGLSGLPGEAPPELTVRLEPAGTARVRLVLERAASPPLPPIPRTTPVRAERGLSVCRLIARRLGAELQSRARGSAAALEIEIPLVGR